MYVLETNACSNISKIEELIYMLCVNKRSALNNFNILKLAVDLICSIVFTN